MTFNRQNLDIPYSLESLIRLDNSCVKHNCREIYYAVDKNDIIHAVSYIVWDDNSSYGLMSGGADPKYRNSGASTLLVWNAIKYSSERVNKINFGGSIIESIESFFFDLLEQCKNHILKYQRHLNINHYLAYIKI